MGLVGACSMRLLEQYGLLHARGMFPGMSILQWGPEIAEIVGEFKSKTILDYGCGLGLQYRRERIHRLWANSPPVLYDPAVERYSAKPEGQFDGVLSTDVLEHIPEEELDAVLTEIFGYATQWVFLSVCCRPSKHILFDDGTNVHVTVKPQEWWNERIAEFSNGHRAKTILRFSE